MFIDTSAWIDLVNSNEHHHAAAVAFHKSLAPMTLRITSWGIVSETFTWIRYHIGYREALRWLSLRIRWKIKASFKWSTRTPRWKLECEK